MTKYEALKTYFGYDEFRGGQQPAIDALLSGRDTLAIMPTGAGKSVCYQIPALLLPGITLVISPLVSLMRDQVTALVQMGIPAAFLNSSLTFQQYLLALDRAKAGRYKIIYVAPERLETDGFRSFAEAADISLVAVDEAHCISQWGQDFRPSYLNIPAFVNSLKRRPPVGAFTATATPDVKEDIEKLLELKNPLRITTGFNRKNLFFEVRQPASKKAALLELVRSRPGKCGIVYCATRRTVEEVCGLLQEAGVAATRYHAGLEPEERRRNQEDFLYDRAQVMVATNAFGMGIDKSDVRYVIHYNMPKDLESYYQEAGRAGRDGLPSSCILLYGGQDVRMARFLIEHGESREDLDQRTAEMLRERDLQRLRQMTGYCQTRRCLRQYILHYFGQSAPDDCGSCANCLTNFEEVDVSREARAILRCVTELGGHFGVGVVAETLCGADTDKVRKYHLDREESYGLLQDSSQKQVRECIRFLVEERVLALSDGVYPVLELGEGAADFLRDGGPLLMKREKEVQPALTKRAVPADLDGPAAELFGRLRALRAKLARMQGVPAYVVFTDKTLREMALTRPGTMKELQTVGGVGAAKAERYGRQFLAEIAASED